LAALTLLAIGAIAAILARARARRTLEEDGDGLRVEVVTKTVAMIFPEGRNEDNRYSSPEEAALMHPRRLDQQPRVVSVEMRDDSHADVEIDRGRHPADRIVHHCVRESDGRWWAQGSSEWIQEMPEILAVARPSESLAVFIHEYPDIDGYEVMTTGYDFASTHASHHRSIEEAKAHAVEMTGIADLDWQPWTPLGEDWTYTVVETSSWRPSAASDPDEGDEWRFRPLAEQDPEAVMRLIEHFAPLWLEAARLPMHRLGEVPDTVELLVAESWNPADGTLVLRLRSWYTGETRWLYGWDGEVDSALPWIEEVADLCGGWVEDERSHYGNRTPWDE
jgi:hypothetical protein